MSKNIIVDKKLFRDKCSSLEGLPVFFQDWWLDTVSEAGEWDVLLYEEDPNIIAIFTFYKRSKGPFLYITMPFLTKFMGPFFLGKFSQKKQQKILSEFVQHLPVVQGFEQSFHYQVDNWLPFFWKNYRQTIYYSYVINDLQNLEDVYQNISADYRNNKISKAEQTLQLVEEMEFMVLYNLIHQTFERQERVPPISKHQIESIYKASLLNKKGKVFGAKDPSGNMHSAIFIVWDDVSAYLLLSGNSNQYKSSGANIFLIWKAIEYTSAVLGLSKFDFLGSMIPGIERVWRQFGAEQSSYYFINKYTNLFLLLKSIKKPLK